MTTKLKKVSCIILALVLMMSSLPGIVPVAEAYASNLVFEPEMYVNGTADDTSKDAAESDTNTYSINYDPNDGVITYGVVGNVGARKENDTNNVIYKGTKYKLFPSYYASLKNAQGELLFPDYDGSPQYDYSEMLTYAINEEANNKVTGADTYEIRVEEGVYYFGKAIKVWGEFKLNGIYGKTVFVTDANDEGAFIKAGSSQTYLGGSITDITFVAKDAHSTFVPTQSAETIHANTLNYSVQPLQNHACFLGMNISWFTLKNCTFSGFSAPLKGVKGHMCTHIQNNTFGPCRVALDGLHFIDCFIHDNYFMGAPITKDGHMDLPLFTTGIGPNLTTINNNYIQNFFYGKGQSDTYGVTYTNNTYDRVYGIEFYAPGDASNAVSQCLFKNNTYKDIAAFFEGFGYTPYTKENTGENAYVIHALSYEHKDNLSGIAFNKVQADNKAYIIDVAGGTTITQCKFEEKDMSDTELFRIGYYSNTTRDNGCTGTQILDNAYQIDSYQKDDIFRDNINLKNGSLRGEWNTKYFLSKKTTKEACVYYSPNGNIKIDLSCFFEPSSNETLGYSKLSTKVGANEAQLSQIVAEQYYRDIQAGRKVVYLSDFGATADDYSSDSMSIQKAFDTIAETGDILIVEGTYNITTPILLRGGKNYRVVCNGGKSSQNNELVGGGFALNVQDKALVNTGAFVQDKDDNGKIGGYFLNWNVYPNNIGQNIACIDRKAAVFYQVRFDKMHISNYRFGNTETVFEECSFNESVVERGYSHYSPYGIMKRCIFKNSVLRHAYATGSLCDYGIGYTYAYYLVDTDFVNSTMRGNWIEFMQMSNGFRFNGDGNSLYTGNVWDYVWNFQFGRNDIFTGNNLTHCATTSVTNHLQGPDGIARDKWTSEIKAGNITSMHVSDGVKIVGNVFSDGSTQYTTYFNFDGRTSLYNYGGKTVTSISNTRVAGNIGGNAANAKEMVQVLCSDNLLKENCVNNQIDLTSMAKSKKYFPENQTYAYNAETLKAHVIPGTLAYVWGPEESFLHYYGSVGTPKAVTKLPGKSLVFDLEYKLDNTNADMESRLKLYTYDFANKNAVEITEHGKTTAETGDIVSSYKKRISFISPLNDTYKEPVVSLVEAEQNPDNVRVLYSQTAYLNSEVIKENKGRNSLPPIYLFSDNAYKNKYFTFSADLISPVGSNPMGDFPVVIYGEDDTYYYGVQVALQNSYALRAKSFKIKKEYNNKVFGVNSITGGVVPREFGTAYKVSCTDISSEGKGKQGNNVNGNVYFDGSNTEANKSNSEILIYDETNLNTPILGMKIACEYGYSQNTVEVYAVLNFGTMMKANDASQKITERKLLLGSFSLNGIDTAPGILFFNDTWIESLSYGVDPDFDRTKVEEFNPEEEEPEVCPHTFTEYIRVKATCVADGYDSYICSRCKVQLSYEVVPAGHTFTETILLPTVNSQGYTKYDCSECGYSYTDNFVSLPTATPMPTATVAPTKAPTSTPRPTATTAPTKAPTATPKPTATTAPTKAPTSTPKPTATTVPTKAPTSTPKPTATTVPTKAPTSTPKPTATTAPTKAPTSTPKPTATIAPTKAPTVVPETTATPKPTATIAPTKAPTVVPEATATPKPTETVAPTIAPTVVPEATATPVPTEAPTVAPTPTEVPFVPTGEYGDLDIYVIDTATKKGVNMAVVFVVGPDGKEAEYTTNIKGQVLLAKANEGEYKVSVQDKDSGVKLATQTITVVPNETVTCELKVNVDAIAVIAPEKKPLDVKTIAIAGAAGLSIVVIGMFIFFRKRRG